LGLYHKSTFSCFLGVIPDEYANRRTGMTDDEYKFKFLTFDTDGGFMDKLKIHRTPAILNLTK